VDVYLPTCPECKELFAERKPPEAPPCESCRVELQVENEDAAHIYMLTRRQYITAEQGRVVDISIPAVKIAMDLYQVRNQRDCLMKVRNAFHYFMNAQREG